VLPAGSAWRAAGGARALGEPSAHTARRRAEQGLGGGAEVPGGLSDRAGPSAASGAGGGPPGHAGGGPSRGTALGEAGCNGELGAAGGAGASGGFSLPCSAAAGQADLATPRRRGRRQTTPATMDAAKTKNDRVAKAAKVTALGASPASGGATAAASVAVVEAEAPAEVVVVVRTSVSGFETRSDASTSSRPSDAKAAFSMPATVAGSMLIVCVI